MLVHRWYSAGVRFGLLTLLILACSLAIPEEVFARPGGGSSYTRPGRSGSSSSGSSRIRRRYDYGSSGSSSESDYEQRSDSDLGEDSGEETAIEDHEAGLPLDVTRHVLIPEDAEWWDLEGFNSGFVRGYRSKARELLRAPGREAAAEDNEAGLGFDLSRHEPSISGKPENAQREFRIGYVAHFQDIGEQNRDCIEAYVLPDRDVEHARLAGELLASSLLEEHRDLDDSYWEDKQLCEKSVITTEQAKAFQRGFSSEIRKTIARKQETERKLEALVQRHRKRTMVGGVLGTILFVIAVVIGVFVVRTKRKSSAGTEPSRAVSVSTPAASPDKRWRIALHDILAADPSFSLILFEDYAIRLYSQLHREAAPGRDIESMRCYATDTVRRQLREAHQADPTVPLVLVASLRIKEFSFLVTPDGSELHAITCEVESNVTTGAPGNERTLYLRQQVEFARRLGVQTRPPDGVSTFGCPICRALFSSRDAIRCDYCGNEATDGRAAWLVNQLGTVEQAETAPALTSNHHERGNQLPTVIDPGMLGRWQSLSGEDPSITQESLAERLNVIYHGLNAGWMAIDERQLRPHVSDGLFDYFRYWLVAYWRQGLQNRLENMRLTGWEVAKVARDAFYDAITVRIYATGLDYTIRVDTGAVVSGSTTEPRPYTEYWTLIRGRGVRGAPRGALVCPHCGGALAINMGGHCEYCGVHVTSGEFDWVLSKIEQDDSYGGGLDAAFSGANREHSDRV